LERAYESGVCMKVHWKILIAIGLGIIVSYLLNATPIKPDLQSDYYEYNDKLFWGALPHATVEWADLSQTADMGSTKTRPDGSIVILIDPKLNPAARQARMTLLHEMCHISNWKKRPIIPGSILQESYGLDGHGPAFDGCMLGIAKQSGFKDLW
jgi:hypothetical protein